MSFMIRNNDIYTVQRKLCRKTVCCFPLKLWPQFKAVDLVTRVVSVGDMIKTTLAVICCQTPSNHNN